MHCSGKHIYSVVSGLQYTKSVLTVIIIKYDKDVRYLF